MTASGYRRGPEGDAAGNAGRGIRRPALIVALLCAFSVPAAAADNTASALEAAGWSEGAPGLFRSLPQRAAVILDSGIGGDFVMAPGTSLAWEKRVPDAPNPGNALEIEMYSEGSNVTSEDYRKNRAAFPVSVTAVFGRDSLDLPLKRRIPAFLASFWRGFGRGGIRLTYAAGNAAPAGSMYRTADERTVFILVGDADRGKRISARRDLVADFRAAYGRDPRGPVTRLIVRAERPSAEKETIRAGIRVSLPAKPGSPPRLPGA